MRRLLNIACLLLLAGEGMAEISAGRYGRASAYCDWREYDAALAVLDSIGTDSLAQALCCKVHLLRGDYEAALMGATQTAILWPETSGGRAAVWQAAYASERLAQYDEAIAAYRRAAIQDTGLEEYAGFRIERCRLKKYAKPGRKAYPGDAFCPSLPPPAASAPAADAVPQLSPGDPGKRPNALKLAARHVRRKRYDTARTLLVGFIRAYPKSAYRGEAAYQIAKGWERQGKLPEALAAYRTAAGIDPSSRWTDDAVFRMGWCRLKQNDTIAALATWNVLITGREDNDQRGASLYWSAKILNAQGDSLTAQTYQEQLRQSYPYSFYGLKARRVLDGIDSYGDSAELESDSTGGGCPEPETCAIMDDRVFLLGRKLAEYGLSDDAASVLSMIERFYQHDASSLYHLAKAFASCGRDGRAIDVSRRALKLGDGERPADLVGLMYPRKYLGAIIQFGAEHGLDPAMVLAVIHKESRFEEKSRSRAGARGLMQIMPATGRRLSGDRRFNKDRLYDPFLSIQYGTRFLAGMLREFNGSWPQALAAYNAGPGRVRQWLTGKHGRIDDDFFLEEIYVPETKRYIMVVMENYHIYSRLLLEEGA